MKKIFLGTTGLVGAAMLAASASAETPKVTVGGFIDFQAGLVDDDNNANQRDYGFRNDTEVSIRVDGKADSGLGYGAVIDMEADVTADANNEGLNAARTYVYLDGGFGRFEMGSNEGAAATMSIDADNIAVATGGINGAWVFFANRPSVNGNFITKSQGIVEHGSTLVNDDESFVNNNKITYYSPRFSGFQVGVSYAPDLSDRGQNVSRLDNTGGAGDIFDLAANYEGQFDMVNLGVAGAYTFGDGDATVEDINAWNLGAHLGFKGFSIAGSYGDWGDSLQAVGGVDNDSSYYSLGAAYEGGPYGLSVTWLDSEVETAAGDNEFNNLVFGADYKLAPGLVPYAELSLYEFEGGAAGAANDNDGSVFILGTQLQF